MLDCSIEICLLYLQEIKKFGEGESFYIFKMMLHRGEELSNLLLVHGQVTGQNPLVQPRFTCPKIVIFSYFSKKTYIVGTH